MGLGQNGTEAEWDGDIEGRGHSGTGPQWDGKGRGWGYNGTVVQLDGRTMGGPQCGPKIDNKKQRSVLYTSVNVMVTYPSLVSEKLPGFNCVAGWHYALHATL